MLNKIINILFVFIVFFSISISNEVNAVEHNWVSVPKSKYGEQLWDKKSFKKNDDGSFRVLSKFIPKQKNDITQDILYTMDINCIEKTFRDVAVGSKEFEEYKNINSKWKFANGDKLILGVINQVCDYE